MLHAMSSTEEECGPPIIELSYNGVQGSYPLTMDWHQSYETKNREFIFMVTYAVVSGLWVAASALIIRKWCQSTYIKADPLYNYLL